MVKPSRITDKVYLQQEIGFVYFYNLSNVSAASRSVESNVCR